MSNITELFYELKQPGDVIQEILDNALYMDGSNLAAIQDEEARNKAIADLRRTLGLGSNTAFIDDNINSKTTTWSSEKIASQLFAIAMYDPIKVNKVVAKVNNGEYGILDNVAKIGSTISSIEVVATFNKAPTEVTVRSTSATNSLSGQLNAVAGDPKIWKGTVTITPSLEIFNPGADDYYEIEVVAKDELLRVAEGSCKIIYCAPTYCGSFALPEDLTTRIEYLKNNFTIFTESLLTKKLVNGKLAQFTANANTSEYICYCISSRVSGAGVCNFTDKESGFTGGFEDPILVNGYYVYVSQYSGLGDTTLQVF